MSLEPIPALDLREGRVVRLRQGDYARQTDYAVDAVVQARRYRDAGARWLHVVDLDGARSGRLDNLRTIEAMARLGFALQAGGGVRGSDDLVRLFEAGVQRVVVGSVAVRDPACVGEWIARHGAERIVVALDTRFVDGAWRLSASGWTEPVAATLDALAPRFAEAGARHLLCTDIDRDGMLAGPNLALYAHLGVLVPTLDVQASGGVRDLGDIRALAATPAAAVILGRCLLEGRVDLSEALTC
ncbi:HisA/HisF-related TIM barrel protein [Dokdonella sp.]|uniref:1-(5-phosphoribosyl)-5-[(5- phosphoribosylamino)methylideneamino]imidazole-4- carboxamide isomerase n=1 Tax=Dokdonella sp. TaxID=2291710 RepID=UPI0025BB2713|nr:HisA/HisF-related TIM barrel protein [Dokdonella sp.]MBX3692796.1 1-(5-phosphoribosyl)-5-((5-phosphoribosylamino)methylideneamino)imidazole-4-carboxamide isomerase [Dokdonella sp.]MCW5568813.1 1-(5-phosphoribosyl)-5-((5-phosphoribosylamino)methylideneamino)imidazole-4-carboxamide isomerase [Dokdonella sp.]